jgi:cytochrome c oxidase cbb3-type subunit III
MEAMSDPAADPHDRRFPVLWRVATVVAIGLGLGVLALGLRAHDAELGRRLLDTPAAEVTHHPDLVRYAVHEAAPLFKQHCAECHGADMKGQAATGAPNLTDAITLYGDGVTPIERTILYGVRSGRQKANDVTEMPAYGQRGQLADADIRNVVQYLLKLNRQPHDDDAAVAGQAIYGDKGGCYDCHAGDAKGNTAYGAPDLTANVWDYGGDAKSLYNSIYYGRHGIMPSWIGRLSLEQIRALAVYVRVHGKP